MLPLTKSIKFVNASHLLARTSRRLSPQSSWAAPKTRNELEKIIPVQCLARFGSSRPTDPAPRFCRCRPTEEGGYCGGRAGPWDAAVEDEPLADLGLVISYAPRISELIL